jgi:hypothetical protein
LTFADAIREWRAVHGKGSKTKGAVMNREVWVWVVAVVALLWTPVARGAAHVQFIDVGTPKSGALVMEGWRGVVVRISLDDGLPITQAGLEIYANIAQRWTDPQGMGLYTETSPGPLAADNSSDSDFNFDSHFLPTDHVDFDPLATREFDVISPSLFTARDPIPSTPFVGYGATQPERVTIPVAELLTGGGHLVGSLDVQPQFPQSSIDVAYVVADGLIIVGANVDSGAQQFQVFAAYDVPEASSLTLLILGVAALVGRGRRRLREAYRPGPNSLEAVPQRQEDPHPCPLAGSR